MSYWYLATPYSKHPEGHLQAHIDACTQAALLISYGLRVFSPIAHSHPIAIHGSLDHLDHGMWLYQDEGLIHAAIGLIECRIRGWEDSRGMKWERELFEAMGKPIVVMRPGVVPEGVS